MESHERALAVAMALKALVDLLSRLPIPITLPGFDDDNIEVAFAELDEVRRIVWDQPAAAGAADLISQYILEWHTALDIASLLNQEHSHDDSLEQANVARRSEAFWLLQARMRNSAEMIAAILDGEIKLE
ncbi:MAG: hypothetical protein ACRDXX_08295 [Stackebrandtia sp.]